MLLTPSFVEIGPPVKEKKILDWFLRWQHTCAHFSKKVGSLPV